MKYIQRGPLIILMIAIFACLGLPSAAADDDVENLLLPPADLPAGFAAQAEEDWLPPNDRLAQFSCRGERGVKQLAGVVVAGRTWSGHSSIVENLVGRVVSEYAASHLQRDIRSCFRASPSFMVDGVPDADGRVFDWAIEDIPVSVHMISFRRGEFVFVITTIEPRPGSPDLAVRLAATQAARAPGGSSDPASPSLARDPAGVIGYTFGTLSFFFLVWPEIKDAVSSWLERTNRHRRRPPTAPDVPPDQIVDVAEAATWLHLRAAGLFFLELIVFIGAISVVFNAIRDGSYGGTAVLLSGAVAAMLGLGWLRRKTLGRGRAVRRRPSILSTIVTCVAVVMNVLGIGLLILGAIPADSGQDLYTGETTIPYQVPRFAGLLLLVLSVAIQRVAVRLTISRPAASVLRDRRPPILYLRSFADDKLTVRIAPVARASLLERFSSRRKQGFEEVLAEELQRHGPVVAIGEPGRHLPPIGFVHQSLDGADWQVGVRQRMLECGVVVVVVGRSHGLTWELKTLFELGEWTRVLLVFPPVDNVVARWTELVQLLEENGLHGVGFPSKSSLLALTFTATRECRYFCGKDKSAWSYKAAAEAALCEISASPHLTGLRPRLYPPSRQS